MRPATPFLLIAVLAGLAACKAETPPAPAAAPPPAKAAPPTPAGGLLPLARVLAIANARTPGEVIDVELDDGDDDEGPSYEIKTLTPEGRSIETRIDARTGRILAVEED